jgi:O-antigen/teichoic acid export membrane protein
MLSWQRDVMRSARLSAIATGIRARVQHLKNATWSVIEYLFFPLLALLTTPFFLATLGQEEFGLAALITAITSLSGPANLGMAAVTVKYVSAFRGEGDDSKTVAVVRKTLGLACAAGLVVSGIVLLTADWITATYFQGMGDPDRVALALRLGAVSLAIAQADMVFASAIKGCERYDVTARFEIVSKLVVMALSLLLAWIWQSVIVMLSAGLVLSLIACTLRGYIAGRIVGGAVWLPSFRGPAHSGLLNFAGWSWLQSNAGAIFQTFDRILVGSALGAAAIAAYTVSTQLGSQVHAVPAAAMAFLFPLMSRKLGAGHGESARRVETIGVLLTVGMVTTLGLVLAVLREPILTLWLGEAFAHQYSELFLWIVVAYVTLGLGIAPYFLLLGRGDVQFVSMMGIVGGAASLAAMLMLVEPYGLLGIAWSRMLFGVVSLAGFARLAYLRRKPSAIAAT